MSSAGSARWYKGSRLYISFDAFCESCRKKLISMTPQVLAAKEQYDLVKVDREQAQTDVLAHGRIMAKLKREEVEAAERITDDHVDACDRGKSLGDIFPSIRVRKYRTGNSRDKHWRDSTLRIGFLQRRLPERKTGRSQDQDVPGLVWSTRPRALQEEVRFVSSRASANARISFLFETQVGYIITRLLGIVNLRLEDVPFEEVSQRKQHNLCGISRVSTPFEFGGVAL